MCARLVFLVVALLAGPRVSSAISSRVLIDPMGENEADSFGSSVASIGDVNGDGYDDLIVGANFYQSHEGPGRAYLYFGGPAIDAVADLVLPAPVGSIAYFGISVASAGDFNDDGSPDFIVGAQYAGYEGKAFVYYGGPSLDATPDLTLTGESTGSLTLFGASVAPAGDVNEDGVGDVIIGAPCYGSGGSQIGRAYVFFGGAVPDAAPDRVFTGVGMYDQLGSVVGSAGDMNGDGHPDLFASAPYNDAGAINAGALYVWFGGPGSDTTPDLTLLGSGTNERLVNAANAGDVNGDGFSDLIAAGRNQVRAWFGGTAPNAVSDLALAAGFASVAGAGDVNGDGIDDFVVGAPIDGAGGTAAGRVSVFFGGSSVDAVEDVSFLGDHAGRNLGSCVAVAGQVDGPGPADLIASSYEDPGAIGYNQGRVYVFANSASPTAVLPTTPGRFAFLAPRPNPASNEVRLVLELDHAAPVRVTVHDLAGREVGRPIANERLAGRVTRIWSPGPLPEGVYYVRAQIGDREQIRKVIWLGNRR